MDPRQVDSLVIPASVYVLTCQYNANPSSRYSDSETGNLKTSSVPMPRQSHINCSSPDGQLLNTRKQLSPAISSPNPEIIFKYQSFLAHSILQKPPLETNLLVM